jgi:hypothetical protein
LRRANNFQKKLLYLEYITCMEKLDIQNLIGTFNSFFEAIACARSVARSSNKSVRVIRLNERWSVYGNIIENEPASDKSEVKNKTDDSRTLKQEKRTELTDKEIERNISKRQEDHQASIAYAKKVQEEREKLARNAQKNQEEKERSQKKVKEESERLARNAKNNLPDPTPKTQHNCKTDSESWWNRPRDSGRPWEDGFSK